MTMLPIDKIREVGKKLPVWNQLSPRKPYKKILYYKRRKGSPIIIGLHWSAIYRGNIVRQTRHSVRESCAERPWDILMIHGRIFKHKQESWV